MTGFPPMNIEDRLTGTDPTPSADDAARAAWLNHGRALTADLAATHWALADWARDGGDQGLGVLVDAAEEIGVAPRTLWNWASVARRIPAARRRPGLSFSHHAEVAALPAAMADRLLAAAAAAGWSVTRLRDEARTAALEAENDRLRARVTALEEQLERRADAAAWRRDARRTERTLRAQLIRLETERRGILDIVGAIADHPGLPYAHGNARRAKANRLRELLFAPPVAGLTADLREELETRLAIIGTSRHAASEEARAAAVQAELDPAEPQSPRLVSSPARRDPLSAETAS